MTPRRPGLSHAIAALVTVVAVCTTAPAADAAEVKTMQLAGGTRINYALALPEGFKAGQEYPVLVALPGGPQTVETALGGLERFWEEEAVRRGFVVVAPSAPRGKLFHRSGTVLLRQFLDRIAKSYRVKADRFHLAGHSNGAVSAFRAAVRYPELFQSLTVIAGFPEARADFARLNRLKNITITMFAGDGDLYWKEGMQRTFDRLKTLGMNPYFEIVPRNGHFLPQLSFENSRRIFEHIKP